MPDIPGPDAPAEPLITVTGITTLVGALISGAVAFGLHISDDQKAAIIAVVAVVAPIVVGVWGRSRVYSPATVRALLDKPIRRRLP